MGLCDGCKVGYTGCHRENCPFLRAKLEEALKCLEQDCDKCPYPDEAEEFDVCAVCWNNKGIAILKEVLGNGTV